MCWDLRWSRSDIIWESKLLSCTGITGCKFKIRARGINANALIRVALEDLIFGQRKELGISQRVTVGNFEIIARLARRRDALAIIRDKLEHA